LTLDRLRRRRAMVRTLDDFARDVTPTPLTGSRDQFTDQAYDLLTSSAAQAAFKIEDEPAAVRDRYGRTPLGQGCLLARRLIEARVAFVTLNDRGMGQLGWGHPPAELPLDQEPARPARRSRCFDVVADLEERGCSRTRWSS